MALAAFTRIYFIIVNYADSGDGLQSTIFICLISPLPGTFKITLKLDLKTSIKRAVLIWFCFKSDANNSCLYHCKRKECYPAYNQKANIYKQEKIGFTDLQNHITSFVCPSLGKQFIDGLHNADECLDIFGLNSIHDRIVFEWTERVAMRNITLAEIDVLATSTVINVSPICLNPFQKYSLSLIRVVEDAVCTEISEKFGLMFSWWSDNFIPYLTILCVYMKRGCLQ